MPESAPVTHVLFDMDGVLLDTEIIYTRATQTIVGRYGRVFDWSVKGNMIGRPAADSARYLVTALDLPITADEYLTERRKLLLRAFADCDPKAGAERLVRHLHRHHVAMAVATSSDHELFKVKTGAHQTWFSLFDAVVTGDDPAIKRGKPAPDIFHLAAGRINAPVESTLIFEDAPSGLAAGVAAGMRVVAVPDPNMDRTRFREADLILDSLEDFDPAGYHLPAFD